MNATQLLAAVHGVECSGTTPCFYCGNPAREHALDLKSSFNEWWTVAAPDSGRICAGCEIALREKIEVPGKHKPQKTRNYSWLVTRREAVPFTKGQIAELREIVLAPPDPPWALALAVSGQKHLLYRTPSNLQVEPPWAVQLETETVVYSPGEFRRALTGAEKVAAALGKPALDAEVDAHTYLRYHDYRGTTLGLEWWTEHRRSPLGRLAQFLCPSKEQAQHEHPRHTDDATLF